MSPSIDPFKVKKRLTCLEQTNCCWYPCLWDRSTLDRNVPYSKAPVKSILKSFLPISFLGGPWRSLVFQDHQTPCQPSTPSIDPQSYSSESDIARFPMLTVFLTFRRSGKDHMLLVSVSDFQHQWRLYRWHYWGWSRHWTLWCTLWIRRSTTITSQFRHDLLQILLIEFS